MEAESGFISFELDELILTFVEDSPNSIVLNVNVDILNNDNIIRWVSTSESKFSTGKLSPFTTPNSNSESTTFILGFNQLFQRSSYFDLTSKLFSTFANAEINIKICQTSEQTIQPEKGKGAKAAPITTTIEETIVEIKLPFYSLFRANGSTCQFSNNFAILSAEKESNIEINILKTSISAERSQLTWKIAGDTNFAEFVLGSSLVRWEETSLSNLPPAWGLHYNDVIDPKQKVQPTPSDLRNRYLDNIKKLVVTQSSIALYRLALDISEIGEDGQSTTDSSIFPVCPFQEGSLAFDESSAALVPLEEPIRERPGLFRVSWPTSPFKFLHRSDVRGLLRTLQRRVPLSSSVTFSKQPTEASASIEGPPLDLKGEIDLSALIQTPGLTSFPFSLQIPTEETTVTAQLTLTLTAPLIPKRVQIKDIYPPGSEVSRPSEVVSLRQAAPVEGNKDVLREFRAEVSSAIRQIASQYVLLYPTPPSRNTSLDIEPLISSGQATGPPPTNMSERRAEFLHFLSKNGIYHDMKEKLKSKLQRVVRERYGRRGRALNRLASSASSAVDDDTDPESAFDSLLSELYVFLVQECNLVLNKMFSSTLIERDVKELEADSLVDDEVETPTQKYSRLLTQALDSEADNRFFSADQSHLERLQLIDQHPSLLGVNADTTFDAFSAYGEFLLRQAALLTSNLSPLYGPKPSVNAQMAESLFSKAREVLDVALNVSGSKGFESKDTEKGKWRVRLLFACCLVESSLFDQAEGLLNGVLQDQLGVSRTARGNAKGGLGSLQDIEGYESDLLVPVNPVCYAVLAAYFSIRGQPLRTRKALILANRSYIEGEFSPPVSSHGTPRRTIVLLLSQAALYLAKFGFSKLVHECTKLALNSEDAVVQKAIGKGRSAPVIPFISHLLKRAQYHSSLLLTQDTEAALGRAVALAGESISIADNKEGRVDGLISQARAQWSLLSYSPGALTTVIESYLSAIREAQPSPSDPSDLSSHIPLESYLHLCKLLLSSARFSEAVTIALNACKSYPSSASLFLIVGICCLRLDRHVDAEDALTEANLLDPRNPEVWAYLTLVCLSGGSGGSCHRLEEADRALFQALRLDLSSVSLLRELATAHVSVDRLSTAEDLIRRALAIESEEGREGRPNPLTRKLFADILAGQNQAALAISEYQEIISDPSAELSLKLQVADQGQKLLTSLGRHEDAKSLKKIKDSLSKM